MHDLRLAARQLANSPGFAAVTIVLLGAGIASNVLIFTAADAVLWRPLSVDRPEELVRVVHRCR